MEELMLKQINNVESFIDTGYNWILHEGSPQSIHYRSDNTLHYQVFDVELNYIKNFAEENFKHYTTSIIKQPPGMSIPLHIDQYWFFKSKFNIDEKTKIYRANIFLEDWKSGHYFEVDGEPIVQWKAGQYYLLDNKKYHRSGNLGDEFKYTAQITGVFK